LKEFGVLLNGARMDSEKPGPILDLEVALAHVDGDRELLAELCTMFIQDYPRLIGEARDAILQNDSSTLERVAHTLKGRLAFFGIQKARNQLMELEAMGRNKDLHPARQALVDIESEMKSILSEFEPLCREPNS
jgi:HPt (histidine-containing phosphotransfer) domain-containing protein